MSIMIVGTDNVTGIKSNVASLGFDDVIHISGRRYINSKGFDSIYFGGGYPYCTFS